MCIFSLTLGWLGTFDPQMSGIKLLKSVHHPGPHLECEWRAVAAVRQSREQRRLESQMSEWQLVATWSVGSSSWDLRHWSLVIIRCHQALTWQSRPRGECRRSWACSPRDQGHCSDQPGPGPSPSSLSLTRYQPRALHSPCSSQPGSEGGVNQSGRIQTLELGAKIEGYCSTCGVVSLFVGVMNLPDMTSCRGWNKKLWRNI